MFDAGANAGADVGDAFRPEVVNCIDFCWAEQNAPPSIRELNARTDWTGTKSNRPWLSNGRDPCQSGDMGNRRYTQHVIFTTLTLTKAKGIAPRFWLIVQPSL